MKAVVFHGIGDIRLEEVKDFLDFLLSLFLYLLRLLCSRAGVWAGGVNSYRVNAAVG